MPIVNVTKNTILKIFKYNSFSSFAIFMVDIKSAANGKLTAHQVTLNGQHFEASLSLGSKAKNKNNPKK